MHPIDIIWPILTAALPPCEYRTYEGQKALFDSPLYHTILHREADRTVGFAAYWQLDSCTFLEHLAVTEDQRGKGLGARMMKELIATASLPLILEVEPSGANDMADRRIGFYERLGFFENDFPYEQPSMQPGQPPIPLRIMSYPSPLTKEDFQKIRKALWQEVYSKLK